ncbi:MAG: ATP-binding protein [Candidatus Zixiibacteriota bacterium]
MRIKHFLHLDYESHIQVSLVFLILFLVLLNFGTDYLFHQTKQAMEQGTRRQLSSAAFSAGLLWETTPQSVLKKDLSELSFKSGINRISFVSSDGSPLVSSKEILSSEDIHIFRGVKKGLADQAGGWEAVFSDPYADGSGRSYLSCYLPLEGSINPPNPEAKKRIWVMAEKEVSNIASIEKVSRYNTLARVAGLFLAGFVAILLVQNLLRPYRAMVNKARAEKIIPDFEKRHQEGDTDIAVGIFEQVIRELKQKEKTLQELYRRTDRKAKDLASYNEYILKSMASGMIIFSDQGKLLRSNQAAEAILELSEKQALGKQFTSVLEEKSPLCSAVRATLTQQEPVSLPEIRITKRNGENLYLSLNSAAVKDEQGRMLGVVVFLNDLTELKKLEEEIAFREKMAALGEMSSGLAHELRNSMGAIVGFAKLLKKKKDDESSKSHLVDGITKEAMAMESMLQRFLFFAKPLAPKMEEIDIKAIVEECLTSVMEALRENRITVRRDFQPNLPFIPGDRLLLKQCFQNLIQNSIEAMPKGGEICVRLREEGLAPQEKTLVAEFSDTGCGIPKKIRDKIFNPFFTSKEKGTGLGLSLVRKIVGLHNGKIEFESELKEGTTFRVCLPASSPPETTPLREKGKSCSEPQLRVC